MFLVVKIYSEEIVVRINEVNQKNQVKPVHIFDWFQHVKTTHSSKAGYPLTELISKNLTWVIARYRINIEKYPQWMDKIKISTWRVPERNNLVPREFIIENENNEIIIRATSSLKLIDLNAKKIISPSKQFPLYPTYDKRAVKDDFPPLNEPDKTDYKKHFGIRRQDLDINGHVNNTLYIQWALETIPDKIFENYSVYELEAAFLQEVFYNEKIVSIAQADKNMGFLHRVSEKTNDKTFALLSTKWKESKYF